MGGTPYSRNSHPQTLFLTEAILKKLLVLCALLVGTGVSMACDTKDSRCRASKDLVETLKYKESISELQMGCRGRAAAMSPDNLLVNRPAMLLGIKKGTEGWEQLNKAFDMYLEEACGSDEVIYLLLAGYRVAWDAAMPGEQLEKSLAKAKDGGKEAVAEDMQAISKEVNRVLGPLIASMENFANSNYSTRIKGVLAGDALALDGGANCGPGSN